MADVLLGLGSNVGDRQANLERALELLAEHGRLVAVSSTYETAPVGYADQGDFLNACAWLWTKRSPEELLEVCHAIDQALGRVRLIRNGPRTIDVDLLLWRDDEGKPLLRERAPSCRTHACTNAASSSSLSPRSPPTGSTRQRAKPSPSCSGS
ncbi:MAG: 2-amino-4-hydroxy-6-hydroxymethyldihydropteridine diphosphokinase [Bryobacterales bacterium]